MSGPFSFVSTTAFRFSCLTGFIRRAEEVGFLQRGTHRLVAADGRVIATLSSTVVDLTALEGQFRTVCGFDEGEIEGVTSLRVTQVLPVAPGGFQFTTTFQSQIAQQVFQRLGPWMTGGL
ncbi:MAG TPA: hypothetical protein VD969_07860 [Symbiobacteriaceae bacterium]|nr:hypothetical protein [Symbiobacteriaceae bacterium]